LGWLDADIGIHSFSNYTVVEDRWARAWTDRAGTSTPPSSDFERNRARGAVFDGGKVTGPTGMDVT
jgi:hypothetical protein